MVATTATLVSEIIGKARRDGQMFYHINDGVYHTFSGVVYDHWIPNFHAFKEGESEICAVVGPTCDSFDKISLSVELPWNLEVGDLSLHGEYRGVQHGILNKIQRLRGGQDHPHEISRFLRH
jgi:ornithine decarboxylase